MTRFTWTILLATAVALACGAALSPRAHALSPEARTEAARTAGTSFAGSFTGPMPGAPATRSWTITIKTGGKLDGRWHFGEIGCITEDGTARGSLNRDGVLAATGTWTVRTYCGCQGTCGGSSTFCVAGHAALAANGDSVVTDTAGTTYLWVRQ